MALETFNYIDSLNTANPTATDNVSEGDDHIRGIKTTLKNTFPNVNAAVSPTDEELNYVDGVTSAIQTQLDAKISTADDSVTIAQLSATGTASSSTFLRGDNAWTAVDALPSQTGHSGKYLTTDASTASWATLDTDANTTTKGLYEHAHTINTAYSITSTNNAMSAGPVVIGSSGSVTVPATSVWTIV
jgi:hypothetical protein